MIFTITYFFALMVMIGVYAHSEYTICLLHDEINEKIAIIHEMGRVQKELSLLDQTTNIKNIINGENNPDPTNTTSTKNGPNYAKIICFGSAVIVCLGIFYLIVTGNGDGGGNGSAVSAALIDHSRVASENSDLAYRVVLAESMRDLDPFDSSLIPRPPLMDNVYLPYPGIGDFYRWVFKHPVEQNAGNFDFYPVEDLDSL